MRPDDETLVGRCRGGDQEAFETLLERYEKTVFNVALRMSGDRDAASDITQSVFLKVFHKLESFDSTQRFFSWMYRIAVNESINFTAKRRITDELDESVPSAERDPAEATRSAEVRGLVQRALMTLKTDYRAVIVLRHYLGCTYAEMSDVLGVPEKTVKSRLFDARRRLRTALADLGVVDPT